MHLSHVPKHFKLLSSVGKTETDTPALWPTSNPFLCCGGGSPIKLESLGQHTLFELIWNHITLDALYDSTTHLRMVWAVPAEFSGLLLGAGGRRHGGLHS
jgi:hypothetical protein